MFGAAIPVEEDIDYLEHVGSLPSLSIEDAASSFSSVSLSDTSSNSSSLTPSGISSLFVDLPPLDQPGAVTKEGFLHKIGGNVKNWKTRYFRLCPGRLLYFKDGENLAPDGRLGAILLPGATIAIFSPDVHPGHAYCFGLTPVDGDRTYVFDCDSVAHRSEWVAALAAPTRQRLRVVPNSLREGFLTKLGGNVKNWKKRYCVLTRQTLNYHPSHTELSERLGSIPLKGGFIVTSEDDTSSDAPASSPSSSSGSSTFLANNPYSFSLRSTGSERTYLFCTTTKADRDGWLQILNEINQPARI